MRCLFDVCLVLCLFVDASSVLRPPQINNLAQAVAAARYSLFVFICLPHPQNSAIHRRAIPARKFCKKFLKKQNGLRALLV
jgi:hypothetical protein